MNKRYLVYLSNKNNYLPVNCNSVLHSLRILLHNYNNIVVRDIRISSYFIEIDVSTKDNTTIGLDDLTFFRPISTVGELIYLEELNELPALIPSEKAVMSSIFLFNVERYWKSHEVLEGVWKSSEGQTKNLLNGLILVDAAYVHLQKGENAIFYSILNRSLEKFKEYPKYFYDIDMEVLIKDIKKIILSKSTSIIKICLK